MCEPPMKEKKLVYLKQKVFSRVTITVDIYYTYFYYYNYFLFNFILKLT